MPHDLQTLLEGMAARDPATRDGWAYGELAEGIADGRFDAEREHIRATAVARLGSAEIQARSFAPLVLAWLVQAGDRDRAAFDAVTRWYLAEADTRAFDDRLGWLHAVAHGADYLGACATTGIATGAEVLDTLARRTTTPGDAWRDQEEARVAVAAVQALAACGRERTTAWIDVLHDALGAYERAAASEPGRPPSWLHNVYATCSALYVSLAEQPRNGDEDVVVPAADQVRDALAGVLARMTPWLLAARRPASAAVSP